MNTNDHTTYLNSPYYVNDNLVRLPLNLSFKVSTHTEYNNYMNSSQNQIDPSILHITNKFSSMTKRKTKNPKSLLSETPGLNYVIAEKVIRTKESSEINYIAPKNLQHESSVNKTLKQSQLRAQETEYVTIDKEKTPAIQISKKQINDKRMEYAML